MEKGACSSNKSKGDTTTVGTIIACPTMSEPKPQPKPAPHPSSCPICSHSPASSSPPPKIEEVQPISEVALFTPSFPLAQPFVHHLLTQIDGHLNALHEDHQAFKSSTVACLDRLDNI